MEKNFLSLIKTRRSVRAYKSEPVPSKALDAVLEAGTYAPTSGGHQSPTIIAITDPKYRREIAKLNAEVMGSNTGPYYGAPVVILVLADGSASTFVEDGSCVLENMMLAAHALGLGTVWVHREREIFDSESGKALLREWKLPETLRGVGAIALGYPVQNFINAAGIGFGVGINAVIAFYLGVGDHRKADQAATQGLVLAVIHGVVMTVCCITIMPVFLRMFTSSEAVIELGVRYSVVAFAFTLIVTVSMAFEKLFQAVGNMKTTMISLMCGCITNIVLDPVLIFGYGPFPEMGIKGAALATGIGQALTLTIYLVVYLARPIRVHIRRQYILPSKKMVIKLYSIGIPATLNLALPSLLISALNAILAAYSEVYILVLGIYYKLQTFVYLPANGIVQGMRPLIGYNYGAGEHQRVSQIFKIVLCMSGIIMVLGTVICLLIPGQLMGLFTHTEATIQTGETALRIIGAGFIVSAVSVTSSGALEGLGKGAPSLLISLCRYVVVIIPTAFLLSRFFGAVGVWNAFWITEAITAIISICVYYKAIAQSQLSQSTVK